MVGGGSDDRPRPNRLAANERPNEDEPFALANAEKRLENAGYRVQHSRGPTTLAGLVVNEGAMQVHLVEFDHSAAGLREIRKLEALAKQRPFQVQVGHPQFGDHYTLVFATIEEPAKLPLDKLLRIANKAIDLDLVDEAKIETSQIVREGAAEQPEPAPAASPPPAEPSGGSGGGTPSYGSCDTAPSNIPVPPGSPLDADGDGIGCES